MQTAKKGRVSEDTFDDFLASQGMIEESEDRAVNGGADETNRRQLGPLLDPRATGRCGGNVWLPSGMQEKPWSQKTLLQRIRLVRGRMPEPQWEPLGCVPYKTTRLLI